MPVWLVVKAGIPLSEVLTWDVEDVLKFVAMLDHESDHTQAYHAFCRADMT